MKSAGTARALRLRTIQLRTCASSRSVSGDCEAPGTCTRNRRPAALLERVTSDSRTEGTLPAAPEPSGRWHPMRSEEHTSELQSHVNLVCRLLLEKKNSQLSVIHFG